ncbi:hypothetical protein [Candidatus Hodgkinia cicadicola]
MFVSCDDWNQRFNGYFERGVILEQRMGSWLTGLRTGCLDCVMGKW